MHTNQLKLYFVPKMSFHKKFFRMHYIAKTTLTYLYDIHYSREVFVGVFGLMKNCFYLTIDREKIVVEVQKKKQNKNKL